MTKYECLQKCFTDQSFDIYKFCECERDDEECINKCTTQCSEGEDYDYFGDYSFDPVDLLTCQEIYKSCDCIDVKDDLYITDRSPTRKAAGSLDANSSFIPVLIPCLAILVLGGTAFYKWRKTSKRESSQSINSETFDTL